jgi:hypothetical protein
MPDMRSQVVCPCIYFLHALICLEPSLKRGKKRCKKDKEETSIFSAKSTGEGGPRWGKTLMLVTPVLEKQRQDQQKLVTSLGYTASLATMRDPASETNTHK